MKNQKLKKILRALTPDTTAADFASFDAEVSRLKSQLKEKVTIKTLDDVQSQLEKFKKKLSLEPLLSEFETLKGILSSRNEDLMSQIDEKTLELEKAIQTKSSKEVVSSLQMEVDDLVRQLSTLEEKRKSDLVALRKSIPDLTDIEDRLAELTTELSSRVDVLEEPEDWQGIIDKVRLELLGRINGIGGGSMNRKITFGGVDYLTKYTDINYKAGSNVTFTVATNDQTKMVDVTVSATGGSGSGIVRLITSVSTPTIADAVPTTDYVYLVSGTTTITLPTAVGNSNLYTIKNVGVGTVTINTTSSQTIDGSLTIVMPVQYTSVDLISDTANWSVT